MAPQVWNPEQYRKHTGFVAALGAPLLELLAPQPGERVLDLGCGEGALTVALVHAGCRVVGIDSSAEQVAAARARIEAEFDAIFSNATLHWIKDAAAVAEGCFRALCPGGRFVAEFGGAGNVARIRDALVAALDRRGLPGASFDPWYFPSPEAYRGVLEAAGFELSSIEHFERPTPLPGDVTAWLQVMAQTFSEPVPVGERAAFLAEVQRALAPALQNSDGSWWADYVRLRVVARRPGAPSDLNMG